jgi:hypothetical protein
MGLARRLGTRRAQTRKAHEPERRNGTDRRSVADRRRRLERRIGLDIGAVLAEFEL